MVITEYNITKSFDKKTGKIRYIITKDREIVYDMTFKLSKNRNTPFSPIDFLEAALAGEHLLNVCKADNEKGEISFTNKIKGQIKKMVSLFT